MRRKIQVRTISESNDATNVWVQHLVSRIIIEQLSLPKHLQAKLLYETLPKYTKGEKNE